MNKNSYNRYRKSRRWRTKRRTIMKRAGYKCRKCGRRATQVHHETYRRIGRERLSDLTAVCGCCHKRIHGK
ncbi:MAG: hypothetical protein OXG97_03020 [Candidatus Poribacteria bacterium]|nr:hypothetical protein [Candidatus Poribacteria bacterium]